MNPSIQSLSLPSYLRGVPQPLRLHRPEITDELTLDVDIPSLDLTGCKNLSDRFLTTLPPGLTYLKVKNCGIKSIGWVQNLSSLKILDLTNCPIADDDLKFLPPSITYLVLNHCLHLTEKSIEIIKETCPSIHKISTFRCNFSQ